jgi:hypothetical protein
VHDAVRRHPSSLGPDQGSRRRRLLVLGAVAVTIATLTALFAFGLGRNPGEVVRSPLVGRAAPEFDLQTLDGSRWVRLS